MFPEQICSNKTNYNRSKKKMMQVSRLICKKRMYSPIRVPEVVPFSIGEHVWTRTCAGRLIEYVIVSDKSGMNSTGMEITLDPKTCIRTSPHARFVRVSAIEKKPCFVWVLDSETHMYTGGILTENNRFNDVYELEKNTVVSLTPVHHLGFDNGHVWSISSNKIEVFDVRERVIMEHRGLWNLTSTTFVRTYFGLDSECEFTLNALMDMNGFSCA
jgi:hypothetical protein